MRSLLVVSLLIGCTGISATRVQPPEPRAQAPQRSTHEPSEMPADHRVTHAILHSKGIMIEARLEGRHAVDEFKTAWRVAARRVGDGVPQWLGPPQVVKNLKTAINLREPVVVARDEFEKDDVVLGNVLLRPHLHSARMYMLAERSRKTRKVRRLTTILDFTPETWRYLRCHDVTTLIDGKRREWRVQHHGSVGSGYVSEQLHIKASLKDLRGMARAESVRFKVCSDTYELSSDERDEIRAFIEVVAKRL